MFKNPFKNKKKKLSAIDKFRVIDDTLITFKELSKIIINKVIQIVPEKPGAIETTRLTSNTDNLIFTVSMKKGELWQRHTHDCKETILMYKGKLRDMLTDREATRLNTMVINPYEAHYIIAEEDSIFYVEFKNPNK